MSLLTEHVHIPGTVPSTLQTLPQGLCWTSTSGLTDRNAGMSETPSLKQSNLQLPHNEFYTDSFYNDVLVHLFTIKKKNQHQENETY